jgi:ketosteroid isomerase-like protein
LVKVILEADMACGGTADCAFERAHVAWKAGDLASLLGGLSDDVEWVVLMDGITIPYVASSVGKADMHWRLLQLVGTFRIDRFSVDVMEHGPDVCRSIVSILYIHRQTGEPLDVKLRFTGWQRDGALYRIEERSDAAYVAAYDKFVRYLEGNGGSSNG